MDELNTPTESASTAVAATVRAPQDVMVPNHFERKYVLRNGNRLTARIRPPRDREKSFVAEEILTIEDIPVAEWHETTEFEKLTAMHPSERIVLENLKLNSVTA